jgi:drug/metabolite transporter (DMT)-like permease
MTLPPTPSADGDKAAILSAETVDEQEPHALTPTISRDGAGKPKSLAYSNGGFLSAPLTGPVRPLSPDTISNLSVDEYEQLRPGRPLRHFSRDDGSSAESAAHAPSGFRGKLYRFWIRNKGLAFMLLGQVFGTLMNVTTRLLEIEGNKGKGLHPFQILFARMGITFVLATTYMWYKQTAHFPFGLKEVRWLLVARGLGGFCGVFGMYFSLLYLPLADATVITFLAPSLACWACSILINEPFTRTEKFAGLVSLVGVILIARPTTLVAALLGSNDSSNSDGDLATGNPDAAPTNGTVPADASNYDNVTPAQRLTAVGVALIGVLGSATAYTTIRWIGKKAHPLISVNYFAFGCFVVSVVMQSVLPDVGFLLPADLKEWGYLFFLGTCGFVMVSFIRIFGYHGNSCR